MNPKIVTLWYRRWRSAIMVGLWAAALLFGSPSSLATEAGSIAGTVIDPSGAVVPAATVIIRNSDNGRPRSSPTAQDGSYTFSALAAGTYQIAIDAPGFKPYRQTDLQLGATAALTVDVKLELNSETTTVEVAANSLEVDTVNTQMGEVIGGEKMTAVPLNGRSFTDLLALQPGVIPASSQQPNAVVMAGVTSTPPSGDLNAGNLSVSGQRETSNGFMVNGSDVEESVNMGTAIVPNLDSIQEFRVLTSNFDAEYGNYSGGQVIVVTKSGTNQWHGSGFEFLRNTALDARNYFSSQRAKFDRNQFGGTVGGPLKHDKIFFFADYQGTRMTQGVDTGRISVPSLTDRAGDLSDLASSLTGAVNGQYWANLLSQRLGHPVHAGEPYYTPGCVNWSHCVLPNAQIPQNAWSGPARALLQYIPQPNQAGNVFSTSAYNQTVRDDKGALKLDVNTRWGALSAYYFVDDYSLDNPYPTGQGGANVPGFNAVTLGRAQLLKLGMTKTFGANTINEFHFSYMRAANNVGQPLGGVGPSLASQGFVEGPAPGIFPLAPQIEGIENVSFNDFTFGVDTTGMRQVNNAYQWTDSLSKAIGKHTIKLGGAVHLDQVNVDPYTFSNGAFGFQGTETGVDFADFLLGIASTYTQADAQRIYNRNKYIGLYGQDSWRVRPNLTLNYGLRWDVLPPWHEKYNQIQTLVLGGGQSVVYPGAAPGLVFPGDPGIPRTLAPTKYTNFAPRIGLAYSPGFQKGLLGKIVGGPGKTSVRVGYGMFYTAFEGVSAGIMSANPPYGYDYTSLAPPLFATPFTAASGQDLHRPFPLSFPPFGASASNPNANVDWSQYLPITGVPSFYHGNVPPYTASYTLSLERQLATNTILSFSYVGNQAHHQLVLISANPGKPTTCLSVSQPDQVMQGTATCGPFGEGGTYVTSSGHVIQGTRGPYSSDFDAITYQKTIGNSNYNALELNVRHQSRSLEFLVAYTYSKSIDQSSSLAEPVNPIDPRLSRAISAFDMRHNFVASYHYNLPLDALSRHENRWTQGWSLSGITRFATGLPVTLFNNTDNSLLGTIPNGINNNGVDTPNVTSGNLKVNTDPRNGKPAFNTSLFTLPALGQIGTAPRRFFYGPGTCNFDMALQKNLPLTETKSLQFRLEAFNVFNHAQFYGAAAVNGNISSTDFGHVVNAAPPRLVQLAAKFFF